MASSSSRSASSLSARSKANSVCSISQTNYDRCVEILQRQDSKIVDMERQMEVKEKSIKMLRNEIEQLSRKSDGPSELKTEQSEVERLREHCRLLQSLLDRMDVDVPTRMVLTRSEEAESNLRVEIQKKNELIKDLKFSLERAGGSQELYMEARLKNDRLTKIIDDKENLLAGHQATMTELEKSLLQKAMETSHVVDGVCQKCLTSEGQVATLNDEISKLRTDNRNLSSDRDKLETEVYQLKSYCNMLKVNLSLGFPSRGEPPRSAHAPDPFSRPTDLNSEASSYEIPFCRKCRDQFETVEQRDTHACKFLGKSS